ncbi:LOW QUALITY PROTEIN: purine catabolism regulatory protein [Geomicrobium sp. JCM 19038]|nr:LOW QUALITY PROTEIN: purine catabolism regulatory protein [Geomicrobium sp. JCM 19038]
MQLGHILQLPIFQEADVISGSSGLWRNVENVNMMDAPDIADYLKQDELLITTAYHFKEDPTSLKQLIEKMARRGCAGLGIKTKRFLASIPEDVRYMADALHFPIIELPFHVRLGSIVNQTLSAILNVQTLEMKEAMAAHQTFSESVMSGKGLSHLLTTVSDVVSLPVYLLNHQSILVATSGEDHSNLETLNKSISGKQQCFLSQTHHTYFSLIDSKQVVTAFAVEMSNVTKGMLVVLSDAPLTHRTILTLEQATNVIAFEVMKENAVKQYTQRARNEFFKNYLDDAFLTNDEVLSRAKEFDIYNNHQFSCFVGKMDAREASLGFKQNVIEVEKVFALIEEELAMFAIPTYFFMNGNYCCILAEETGEVHPSDWHSPTRMMVEMIQDHVIQQLGRSVSFGISNICHEFLDVKAGYSEALNALNSGLLSGNRQFIQAYHTKDVSELLRMIPGEDLRSFCEYTLQRIDDPDLLHTLAVYLETHCQITETANRLYVHRNTVIYRLEKIEDLLGKKVNEPETTLQLRIAFRIHPTLNASL